VSAAPGAAVLSYGYARAVRCSYGKLDPNADRCSNAPRGRCFQAFNFTMFSKKTENIGAVPAQYLRVFFLHNVVGESMRRSIVGWLESTRARGFPLSMHSKLFVSDSKLADPVSTTGDTTALDQEGKSGSSVTGSAVSPPSEFFWTVWRKNWKLRSAARGKMVRLPGAHNKFWWCQPGPCFFLARLKSSNSPVKPLLIVKREYDNTEDFLRRSLGFLGVWVGKYMNGTDRTDIGPAIETIKWRNRHLFVPLGPGCVIIFDNFNKWYDEEATESDKQLVAKWSLCTDEPTAPTVVFIVEESAENKAFIEECRRRYMADVVYTHQSMCGASDVVAERSLFAVSYVLLRVVAIVCGAVMFIWMFQNRPAPMDLPRPYGYIQRLEPESELKKKLFNFVPHSVVVVEGPRLYGKTYLVQQVMADMGTNFLEINCGGSNQDVEASIRARGNATPGQTAKDVLRTLLDGFEPAEAVLVDPFGHNRIMKTLRNAVEWFFAQQDTYKLIPLHDWLLRCDSVTHVVLENLDDPQAAKWVLDAARSANRKVIVTTQDKAPLLANSALTQNDPVVPLGKLTEFEARRIALTRLRHGKMSDWELKRWATGATGQQSWHERWFAPADAVSRIECIDTICRDYCDYRPSFVSAVFTGFADTASGTQNMEQWVRDHFASLVTDDAKRFNKDHVSINDLHRTRRSSFTAAQQAVYDDVLGAIAAMNTSVCREALLRCVCDDHGDLLAGFVITRMTNHWNILRADDVNEHRLSVHRLDLQGVERNPELAFRILISQLQHTKMQCDSDACAQRMWQLTLREVVGKSSPQQQRALANAVGLLVLGHIAERRRLFVRQLLDLIFRSLAVTLPFYLPVVLFSEKRVVHLVLTGLAGQVLLPTVQYLQFYPRIAQDDDDDFLDSLQHCEGVLHHFQPHLLEHVARCGLR
jgi:hypothetical protein